VALCSPSNPGNRNVAGEILWFTRMPEQPVSVVSPNAKNAIINIIRMTRFEFMASIRPAYLIGGKKQFKKGYDTVGSEGGVSREE